MVYKHRIFKLEDLEQDIPYGTGLFGLFVLDMHSTMDKKGVLTIKIHDPENSTLKSIKQTLDNFADKKVNDDQLDNNNT